MKQIQCWMAVAIVWSGIALGDKVIEKAVDQTRKINASAKWLLFPIKNGGQRYFVEVRLGREIVRQMEVSLTDDNPDWWGSLDISPWMGKTLDLRVAGYHAEEKGVSAIKTSDLPYAGENLFHERFRPQFHLNARYGWNNDPNGLCWYKGEYHCFYQHNPYGTVWGKMHWGHAVSKDLIHWTHLGNVLYPDALGDMFSGSSVIDKDNSAGFGAGTQILMYTATEKGSSQCLAYSSDGRTYTKYGKNPVLPCITPGNRDPKVFWHSPSHRWVMVMYVEREKKHTVAIFTSSDLKNWKQTDVIVGDSLGKGSYLYECPDLYPLPVEGEKSSLWVLKGADSQYAVGTFDGVDFVPVSERLTLHNGTPGVYYAAQTFDNIPDGRRIEINWIRSTPKDMPFNHMLSLPLELGLRRTDQGLRLTRRPVRELLQLRDGAALALEDFNGELVEVELDCLVAKGASVRFSLRGIPLVYNDAGKTLTAGVHTVAYTAPEQRLSLRIFIDRACMEIFSRDGLLCFPISVFPDAKNTRLSMDATSGSVTETHNRAYRLKSIW